MMEKNNGKEVDSGPKKGEIPHNEGDRDAEGASEAQSKERQPWPLSWVLIVILAYMLFQVAWLAFGE